MPFDSVLVTGATGVIGTATMAVLRDAGYAVHGLSSRDADLRDPRQALEVIEKTRPDAIIHLAARVHGLMGNVRAQGEMFRDNALMNMNVIESARLAGVSKVVAMGSVATYPDGIPLPMRESDLWAGAPHGSEAGYAHAKRAMLAQLEAYQDQYGLEFALAVSTNLFGPNDRFDEVRGHVIPSLISKFHRGVVSGQPVVVWGTGEATRDFLFSFDAARALKTLLESGTGVYNVASGNHITIKEAAEAIAEVAGYQGEIQWDRSKPDGQPARAYDITRIAALGWAPQISFPAALTETFDWYGANLKDVRR